MLNLTRRERYVIAFLVVSFVIGGAIELYKTKFSSSDAFSQIEKEKKEFKKKIQTKADSTDLNHKDNSNNESKKSKNENKLIFSKATKQELMKIKGIGPVTANRILKYREENNNIETIQELTNIKGIGTKTIKKIKNEVTIE